MAPLTRRDFCEICLSAGAGLIVGCSMDGHQEAVDAATDLTTIEPKDLVTANDLATPTDLAKGPDFAICSGWSGGFKSAIGTNMAKFVSFPKAFLCRDAQGVYAISSVCTHSGCNVQFDANAVNFVCPCHASKFDFNGKVLQGPAAGPLVHFAVCVNGNGEAIVTNKIAANDDRI